MSELQVSSSRVWPGHCLALRTWELCFPRAVEQQAPCSQWTVLCPGRRCLEILEQMNEDDSEQLQRELKELALEEEERLEAM